jgi:ABC-type multidrug transport system ATPase subunit
MADAVEIELAHLGKRYKQWIFRDVDLVLYPSKRYGVIGRNGVGKSTLLRLISGYTSPTVGKVTFTLSGKPIDDQQAALMVGYTAPYINLIDELTVNEILEFHTSFKKVYPDVVNREVLLDKVNLSSHRDFLVGDLSSGLMQRLKLGLTILTMTPVILLDEPTSYLDLSGKKWYYDLLDEYARNRLVVVASNDPEDVLKCDQMIDMMDFAQADKTALS